VTTYTCYPIQVYPIGLLMDSKTIMSFSPDSFDYVIWDQDKVQEYLTDITMHGDFKLKGSDIIPGTVTTWICTRCNRDKFLLVEGVYKCPVCGYSPNNTDIKQMTKPRYRIHFRESGTYAIAVNQEAFNKGVIHAIVSASKKGYSQDIIMANAFKLTGNDISMWTHD
jgi:hypothetical protein